MKANELMIGDWVQAPIDVDENGWQYDRDRISKLDADGSWESHNFGIEGDSNEVELLPIPLTEAILERNFGEKDADGDYCYNTDFYDVYISDYSDGAVWKVIVSEVEFSSSPTWRMYISHVHELQQALRLAKVDKEITL